MAEMPVQLGPPFVGITRIRFKGFVIRRLSHRGSPALRFQNKTDAQQVNTRRRGSGAGPHAQIQSTAAGDSRLYTFSVLPNNYEQRRLLSGRRLLFFHVCVKDRVPFALLHLPDRPGVVGARGVFAVRGAFHLHVVGHECGVRIGHDEIKIAKSERFQVPLLHRIYLLLLRLDAVAVDGHEVRREEFIKLVALLVFEGLPGRFFLLHHRVLVRCGDRNRDRREQGTHRVCNIFFHQSFRFVLKSKPRETSKIVQSIKSGARRNAGGTPAATGRWTSQIVDKAALSRFFPDAQVDSGPHHLSLLRNEFAR